MIHAAQPPDSQSLHPFDIELRSLPSVTIGSLVDTFRSDLVTLERRAKREGFAAGRQSAENFLETLIRALEGEASRRDREDGRR